MYSDLTRKEHRRALMDALLDLEDDDTDITAYTTASLLPSPTSASSSGHQRRKSRSRSAANTNVSSSRDRKRASTLKRQSPHGAGKTSPRGGKSSRRHTMGRSKTSMRRSSKEKGIPSVFVDTPTPKSRKGSSPKTPSNVVDQEPVPIPSISSPRSRSTTQHALTLSRRTPTPTNEDPLSANSSSNSSSSPFMDTIPLASSPLGAALNSHTFSSSKNTASKSKDQDTPPHRTHERRKSSNLSSTSDNLDSPKNFSLSPPAENPEQPALESSSADDEDERERSLSSSSMISRAGVASRASASTQTSSLLGDADADSESSPPPPSASGIATLLRQHRRRRSSPRNVSSPASAPHKSRHRRKRSSGVSSKAATALTPKTGQSTSLASGDD